MRTLRAAIIGVGNIGRQHISALHELHGTQARVEAVADINAAAAGAAAAQFSIPRHTTDYSTVLDNPAIDVVHICTTNQSHFELSAAALRNGKHVVTEKPLGLNSTETAELHRLYTAKDRVAAVCFHRRYHPIIGVARSLVASGVLGVVRSVRGHYLQDWMSEPTDWDWRVDPEIGGLSRTVADIGIHWADLVQHILGSTISDVFADLHTLIPIRHRLIGDSTTTTDVPVRTEDYATIMFGTAAGTRGVFTASQVSPGYDNTLVIEIDGSSASLRWESDNPDGLWLTRRGRSPRQLTVGHQDLPDTASADPGLAPPHPITMQDFLSDVYWPIARPPAWSVLPATYPSFLDGHRAAVFVDAVLESARTRRWLSTAEIDPLGHTEQADPAAAVPVAAPVSNGDAEMGSSTERNTRA